MEWEQNFSRGYHVETLSYFYSKEHALIGLGNLTNLKLDNIGEHGENLTFAVLSLNRSGLTIRFMESIAQWMPNFAGEFLIGDNGSVEEEKQKLRIAMEQMPYRCRMVEFDRNYGVAGGRNRLFAQVKTDWLLSADNDLYFIGNPLPKIQKDLSMLGCHFLVLPLIDHETGGTGIYGGHLYIENLAGVSAGGGSVYSSKIVPRNQDAPPFLCTFCAGGVSVINKNTFLKCGGFDEGMFVGFEDTEFSIRLYQQGYKVGSCGMASLVHDHPKPENNADTKYEKARFSVNYIKESARYFEKKHGFCVWNPMVENWVESRLADMTGSAVRSGLTPTEKPEIALIIDRPQWALDNIATQIQRYLSDFYDFKIMYLSDVDNLARILLWAEDCQLIHFFWRPLASAFYDTCTQETIRSWGLNSQVFFNRYVANKKISVAVYDHFLLGDSPEAHFTPALFSNPRSIVNSYTVSTKKLYQLYNAERSISLKPSAITQDGVDTNLFAPVNLDRFCNLQERSIRIGWVGNSKWQIDDLKGINTIIKPAVEILKNKGYRVELITTDRQEGFIPHHEMPAFYAKLDIYVCASICEGTPNPVLEAMSSGVPIISTDVGLIPEVFGKLQSEFVLEERSVQCLVNKLERLLQHPKYFMDLSKENRENILSWDWSIMVNNFKKYFDELL